MILPPPKLPATKKPSPPDEHDAPAGRIAGRPSAPLRQALRDVLRGVQDTSRATEAQRSYVKLKR
ncbi:hypothetical protein OOZ63_05285 [Paucibacter sp. PLA-PC-4]|uniref:hypothetical protein n=1 Tax=Paucibacter sp. PLA-PC-4 TaxID=2993655 RepID=UPI00224913EA|nr:hypothetical protein [Paucibacter sp. PLA-PC-4]MCX2861250.1 hypothetical protein [Paucibacter sp. PLA-PC-4]